MSTDQQTPSRRNFVTGLALAGPAAAIAIPAVAFARPIEPDPIFAPIEAHRLAWGNLSRDCSALDQRRGDEDAERQLSLLHEAINDAEDGLIDVIPTTLVGMVALLKYAAAHVAAGNVMGDSYADDEASDWAKAHGFDGIGWEVVLHRNLAKGIEAIMVGAAA